MINVQQLTEIRADCRGRRHIVCRRKGQVLGFLGPNGAGKSTAMKMLACFLAPDSGTATVCGHDILTDPWRPSIDGLSGRKRRRLTGNDRRRLSQFRL